MKPVEAASGILRVNNANMASATHLISVQRGHDPRDFTLVAGGGAGPLHAVEVARELSIPRVIVPRWPGLTSALGILHVDLRHDFLRSVLKRANDVEPGELVGVFDGLINQALGLLDAEHVPLDQRVVELSMDARYYGQTPYLNLAVERPPSTPEEIEELLQRYEANYLREFGYLLPREFASIEFVNARVIAIGLTEEARLPRSQQGGRSADALIGSRRVFFEEPNEFVDTQIYNHERFRAGVELEGPVIIEQSDSTVALPPGATAIIDDYLNIVISVHGR
jgi:N-methylhydantoinase A